MSAQGISLPGKMRNWFIAIPPLFLGIGISLALHGTALSLHFAFPETSRNLRDKAMDIILVNAKSAQRPKDAQALAQANLDGGGNTDDDRRAKTPLPPTRQQTPGSDVEQMQRRVQELEARQQQLMTEAKSVRNAPAAKNNSETPTNAPAVSGLDLLESARAMARLEGEISKTSDEYSRRPRKKFVGARAEEYPLATYLDAWRQKIERIGTLNYPAEARGKLYGSVVIYVELRADDGSVFNAEISRSSGHKVLDQAALRILRLAGPFGPIPRDSLGGATVLSFARTWQFTQGDTLATSSR